ncbi:MAG: flagellar export chaperone FliS [Gammaproteobacteria bacterium]|nr:flagellar export chaperone FliS [Gammaproteobacteria bacterium]
MTKHSKKSALSQYKKVGTESDAAFANPHRLIQMLFNGALEKISIARGAMERGEIAKKGEHIGWAISIIEGLRTSLDKDTGGEIAENLESLYVYIEERLVLANIDNDLEIMDEVVRLLNTVKSAWDEISGEAAALPANNATSTDSILSATS